MKDDIEDVSYLYRVLGFPSGLVEIYSIPSRVWNEQKHSTGIAVQIDTIAEHETQVQTIYENNLLPLITP